MEQSCSKPQPHFLHSHHPRLNSRSHPHTTIRVIQPTAASLPQQIPIQNFIYSQYSGPAGTSSSGNTTSAIIRGNGIPTTSVDYHGATSSEYHDRPEALYRRNDPANRIYRMKKRPPAQVYHCVQCNKNIKYPSKITEHIRKHTGEKPHVCGICNQSFSQAHTLKTHMQQHSHEKPFKCSFCSLEFLDLMEKDEHEEQHMNHPEALNIHQTNRSSFIQIQQQSNRGPPIRDVDDGVGQMCGIYECPEECGFQSYDEADVIEHIAMGHHSYETVCWGDEEDGQLVEGNQGDPGVNGQVIGEEVDVETGADRNQAKMGMVPVQNGMLVQNFNSTAVSTQQIYEYFPQEFVPEVETESIIHQQTRRTSPEVGDGSIPCTSSGYHFNHPDSNVIPTNSEFSTASSEMQSRTTIVESQIIYEGEEIVTAKVMKQDVGQHIYGNIMMQHLEEEEIGGEEELVDDDEEEQEKVRVILNPNPPKRGTKSLRDHHEATAAMTEMIVDASTLEMAAPSRHLKQGYGFGKRNRGKKAENLDWIIDAVAKGVDVNEASPHVRKKPTLHKCEYCGKVDKYPSKIRAHMRTHTGEKPFKCEICGMAFSQKTPMRLHLRRHFDQKPYACEVDGCKESFVSGAILKLHFEKKHLNKKKYVCIRGCGRVFSSAYNQRHHEKKCSQNTYLTWVEEANQVEQGDDEESNGEYQEEEDEEEYMDAMMDPQIVQQNQIEEQHFVEEPVFLHP
ncbi:hypothetical protein CRE_03952 [Caenorhabditis remanei]|uniref:C2H2-type domain-containing protein n=1 Tax=Caenorhabditis remanei TaxID=31234 RepID=E3LY12_CAERE|nr:hypothetical protein CRE_03952 [Caenorhabditis remanei]